MQTRYSPLVVVAGVMSALAVVFAVSMVADPRTIEGAPAWLKPAKFAVSTALYAATLAWVLGHLPAWPRLARTAAHVTAWVFVVEVALVALQAGRGTLSHFNTATLLDGAIFSVMGVAIALQTLAAVAVTWALWRQPFADRARGWALRLGMALTVVGASTGGLMPPPTAAQLARAEATGEMPRSGAHTVGAPDGGPGLPGTGWSLTHGDLRVPHFVGLHAMQALPLVAWLVARVRRESARVAAVVGASVSYGGLFVVLLAQALAGESVAAPSAPTVAALGAWAALSFAGALAVRRLAVAAPGRAHTTSLEVA